ncbi:MAG: potassium channel family protein [Gemmataceae bacterium]
MKVKRFIVLGLGSFGQTLALRLAQNGCRVTGVDLDERQVEAVKDQIHEAIVADVTDRAVLEQLMLDTADGVFISLGESIEKSILAALHVIDLKVHNVYVKGISREHGRILSKLGVSRVIFPEMEIAVQTADQMTLPNVLESFQFDPDYSIVETVVPASLAGKTLAEAGLPRRFGLMVIGVKEALGERWELMPPPDHVFGDEQFVLVIGRNANINKFCQMQ